MAATYKDFYREPSKPHQCMHTSEKDGTRCRAIAMHNHFMCYHHSDDDIPTVIQNDPFLIDSLAGPADIQKALTDVAARLACNHIDLKRASLLIQVLQIASANLRTQTQPVLTPPTGKLTAESPKLTADSQNPAARPAVEARRGDPETASNPQPRTTPALPSPQAMRGPQATPPPRLRGWKIPKVPPTPPVTSQPPANNQQPATKNRLPRCQRSRRSPH